MHGLRNAFSVLPLLLVLMISAQAGTASDAEIASRSGDEAAQARRPAQAIVDYRRAQRLGFRDAVSLKARIAGAEAQRQALLRVCETRTDESGRQSCEAARLPGTADEARILRRQGLIEEALHRQEAALEAYLAAEALQPGDVSVAAAIARLRPIIPAGHGPASVGNEADPQRLSAPARQAGSTLESDEYSESRDRRFSNAAPASFSH